MSSGNWFFYWQKSGEDSWIPGAAADRAHIVAAHSPRYSTVLDVDTNFNDEIDRDAQLKAHYRGDLYIDIDVSVEMGGIDTAIVKVNEMLDKYEEAGAKLESFRIFASGSKGFHVEIPRASFLPKESRAGYQKLPVIYKEMVHRPEYYVDGIDPRVYSAQRGRMWRTTNVQRENGRYKVPLTLAECRSLTSEKYQEFVSAPRTIPASAPAEYCPSLGVAFISAQDEVERRLKQVLKSKLDPAQAARWAKKPPNELARLMAGQGVKDGAGFHPIAVQIALAATTFKWSVDEMIERCEGLIQNHVGDGNRYDTPRKRQRELVRLWYYYEGGAGTYYEFALAPIRNLLEYQPEADAPGPDEGPQGETEEEDDFDFTLTSGVKVRRWGLFKTMEGGNQIRASALGFDNIMQMIDTSSGDVMGYQATAYVDGRPLGTRLITMGLFSSRQAMQGFSLANGGAALHLNDAQVVGMAEIFRQRSMKSEKVVHILGREGLDYLVQPDGSIHAVYVSTDEAFCHAHNGKPKNYALKTVGRDSAPIKSDLLQAPKLEATGEMRDYIRRLFSINKAETVAKLLGWFTAAFYSQGIRLKRNQFPLLHVFGTAGAGKTKTCELMSRLHFYLEEPQIVQATSLTPFAMKMRLSSSASIPLIWDEIKFHEMHANTRHQITQYLRNNYVAASTEAGSLSKETGQSQVDLRKFRNGAPLVFIGETMEMETAIADRYVAVALTKQDRGAKADFDYCFDAKDLLSQIGKVIVARALLVDLDAMAKTIAAYEVEVGKRIPTNASDESRRVYNYAVTLFGLDMFGETLATVFGTEFDETIQRLKDAMMGTLVLDLPKNMAESSKVLDSMAYLTKVEVDDEFRLIYGTDYTVNGKGVDIKLQNAFNKYLRYSRSMGLAPLFPAYDKFVMAMRKHPAVVDTICMDNESLKDTARVDVYRFDSRRLEDEGIDVFRS